jgi:hypothetical protein
MMRDSLLRRGLGGEVGGGDRRVIALDDFGDVVFFAHAARLGSALGDGVQFFGFSLDGELSGGGSAGSGALGWGGWLCGFHFLNIQGFGAVHIYIFRMKHRFCLRSVIW